MPIDLMKRNASHTKSPFRCSDPFARSFKLYQRMHSISCCCCNWMSFTFPQRPSISLSISLSQMKHMFFYCLFVCFFFSIIFSTVNNVKYLNIIKRKTTISTLVELYPIESIDMRQHRRKNEKLFSCAQFYFSVSLRVLSPTMKQTCISVNWKESAYGRMKWRDRTTLAKARSNMQTNIAIVGKCGRDKWKLRQRNVVNSR